MSTLHTGTCTVSVCNEHMETRGHVLWIRNVGYAPVLCHCHLFLNLKAPKKNLHTNAISPESLNGYYAL